MNHPSDGPSTTYQLQLTQVEEQVEIVPTGEAGARLSPTYYQQMESFVEDTAAQPNPSYDFSYEEFMEDVIAGRKLQKDRGTRHYKSHMRQ